MAIKNIFELYEVSKSYGEMKALSSLSLNIEKGEIVALVGPSGAGKTTLLNILANVEKPDNGRLILEGKSIESYSSEKHLAKKVGIIRQQFDLVSQLPVIHNVLAGRLGEWSFLKSILSLIIPQDKELAIKALARVGLQDKIHDKTANLSGGEQQRVALARLLVQHPEIILADEPVSSLDSSRAEDILFRLIRLVKEENQTLITSLHSVEYARKYFNRIIALRDGKIFFDLPTEEVTNEVLSELYALEELD